MKPSEILSNKSKWIKYALAVDKNGRLIGTRDEKAVSWCLLGVIEKYGSSIGLAKYIEIFPQIYDKLSNKIDRECGSPKDIIAKFNDSPETAYEDVIQLLKSCDL